MNVVLLLGTISLTSAIQSNLKTQGDVERNSKPGPHVLDAMPDVPHDTFGNVIQNLTVIILPHSHDDTGWQRNVDQVQKALPLARPDTY
jgi:hypothetical protein